MKALSLLFGLFQNENEAIRLLEWYIVRFCYLCQASPFVMKQNSAAQKVLSSNRLETTWDFFSSENASWRSNFRSNPHFSMNNRYSYRWEQTSPQLFQPINLSLSISLKLLEFAKILFFFGGHFSLFRCQILNSMHCVVVFCSETVIRKVVKLSSHLLTAFTTLSPHGEDRGV